MRILKKLFRNNPSAKNTRWSSDLLKDDVIRLFHTAQEAIQAYRANDEILKRREIALKTEQVLEKFIEHSFSKPEIDFLTELLLRNNKKIGYENNIEQKSFNYLKKLDPWGIKLLEIPKNIDIETLKKLYRKASLKYHPDVGGSHDKMVKINESYTLFHNALINFIPYQGENEKINQLPSLPESWNDLLYSVYIVLASINGDYFATDRAFPQLKKAYKFALNCKSRFIGQLANDLSGTGGTLDSTCRALSRFKLKEELSEAARITSYFNDRIFQSWFPTDNYDIRPKREEFPSERDFTSQFGTRLVINHPEKARNAFRLGKIDKKRFDSTMKRFNAKKEEKKNVFSKTNNYIQENGFIQKLSNANYEISASNPQIINSPNFYQDRFDHLDDNQKWEYLKTFSSKGTGKLFDKYYNIRTQEILLGLIHNFDSIDKNSLSREINFFCKNFPEQYSKYNILSEIFDHLNKIDDKELSKKLFLFNQMDDPEPRSFQATFTISLDTIFSEKEHTKRVSVDDDYIEFMKMNLYKITDYQSAGEINNEYDNAWNRDLNALDEFERTIIGRNAGVFWYDRKNPTPEEAIDCFQPYIEGLLKLGESFHPKNTGELQIGYKINKLTAAYGKIKQWDKVVYWCELFFDLPMHYRDRSTESEQNSIRKRQDRAKKLI